MGKIINGKELAITYKNEIREFVKKREEQGEIIPCIATIMVGNDGGSLFYVNSVAKNCKELGVKVKGIFLEESITEEELINVIDGLNKDKEVHGMILQIPLPKHINEKNVTASIDYRKDVDGLTFLNTGRFYRGEKAFEPCTPKSAIKLIKATGIDMAGKHAVVIGRSNIVGKPLVELLLRENATVTICHSKTSNLKEVCRSADILISAIGRPAFVDGDFVKEGAIVIDVGTTMVEGKIKGDVDFDKVIEKASYVTPVPGGVGAMTTTILIKNTCEALEDVY